VAEYRLYSLDEANKVASGDWFEAEDDAKAIEAAKKKMNGHDCELWQRTRLVGRIASDE
jgi:cobalamin biosynthesis protein CbiG